MNLSRGAVIIGGGLAGLTAANRLAARGIAVTVIEAGADAQYLCNSRIASGSFNLAHSDPTADAATLRTAIDRQTDGTAEPGLADALAGTAASAMLWLRAEGVKFIKVPRGARSSWSMAPPRPAKPGFGWQGRGPDLTLQCLTRNLATRGGTIALATRATRLLFEGARCVGVAATQTGREVEFRAAATLLADGGFQGNADLVRRFISPRPECLVQRNARTGRGDALLMAEAAGAGLRGTDRFYGHLLVHEALTNDLLWPYPTIDTLASSAIVVDRAGHRFLDEGMGGVAMANALARLDDPLGATTIFDEAQWTTTGRIEFTPPNPYLASCGGTVFTASTLAQLAEQLGIPADALTETIATYNAAIESGDLSGLTPPRTPGRSFGVLRDAEQRTTLQAIKQPPFHAIRLCAGLTYTMGGIAIDAGTQVLDRAGAVMPGLYAAGACTGGLEGGPMAGYLGGLCKALSLGFIAGDRMASALAAA
jgi:fumarate reductase flavoprotein subunit